MRKLILGLVCGLMIGMMGTALAATNESVQAVFAKFHIQVNQDETVEVKALVHEGTSYYPIRVIADLLNHDVDYVTETRTITLDSKKNNEPKTISDDSKLIGGDEMSVLDEYSLEGIINNIRNTEIKIETATMGIEVLKRNQEENMELPPDERIPQLEQSLIDLENELLYWQDLKRQKEELESE